MRFTSGELILKGDETFAKNCDLQNTAASNRFNSLTEPNESKNRLTLFA